MEPIFHLFEVNSAFRRVQIVLRPPSIWVCYSSKGIHFQIHTSGPFHIGVPPAGLSVCRKFYKQSMAIRFHVTWRFYQTPSSHVPCDLSNTFF